jgi:hypothetical protein
MTNFSASEEHNMKTFRLVCVLVTLAVGGALVVTVLTNPPPEFSVHVESPIYAYA